MGDRPTPAQLQRMIADLEGAGWHRHGFALAKGDHVVIVRFDGVLDCCGPDLPPDEIWQLAKGKPKFDA